MSPRTDPAPAAAADLLEEDLPLILYVCAEITRDFEAASLAGALRRAREASGRAVRTAWEPGVQVRLIAIWTGRVFEVDRDATPGERTVVAAVEAEPAPAVTLRGVRFLTAGGSGATMAAELCVAAGSTRGR